MDASADTSIALWETGLVRERSLIGICYPHTFSAAVVMGNGELLLVRSFSWREAMKILQDSTSVGGCAVQWNKTEPTELWLQRTSPHQDIDPGVDPIGDIFYERDLTHQQLLTFCQSWVDKYLREATDEKTQASEQKQIAEVTP